VTYDGGPWRPNPTVPAATADRYYKATQRLGTTPAGVLNLVLLAALDENGDLRPEAESLVRRYVTELPAALSGPAGVTNDLAA
jgi:hypothetical protein